jgi:hypothetical protein
MALDPVTGGEALADDVTKVIGATINRIWPDKTQIEKDQMAAALAVVQGQLAIDNTEAGNTRWFISGWRPFIGWICGVGLCTQFLIGPLCTWGASLLGKAVVFPTLDMGTLLTLLLGMLGLAAMRTTEKIQGVAAK